MDDQKGRPIADSEKLDPVEGSFSGQLDINGERATKIDFQQIYFYRTSNYFFIRLRPTGSDSPDDELVLRGSVPLECLRVYPIRTIPDEGEIEGGFTMRGFVGYPQDDIKSGEMKVMRLSEVNGRLYLSVQFFFHFFENSQVPAREIGVFGDQLDIEALL